MKPQNYGKLNTFRGIGAALVLFYHFFFYFFAYPQASARLVAATPLLDSPLPAFYEILLKIPFDIGHFAVSFFFMISGFLILPSLQRYPLFKGFVTHKFFRLWPTYATSLTFAVLFVAVFHIWRGTDFPYTVDHMLACLFWVRDICHYPYIDGVVWTLEIQIKFYLLAIILWQISQKRFLEVAIATTLGLTLILCTIENMYLYFDEPWLYLVTLGLKNLKYYNLILLGTCFYAYYNKERSFLWTAGLCIVLVFGLFSSWYPQSIPTVYTGYALGIIIMAFLVFVHTLSSDTGGVFKRSVDYLASTSYPLYIGHVVPGYIILFTVAEAGISIYWGLALATLYSFCMAHIVHFKVEVPILQYSKKFRPAMR